MVAVGRNVLNRRHVLTCALAMSGLVGCRQILGLDEGVVAGPGDAGVQDGPDGSDAFAGDYRKEIIIVSPVVQPLTRFTVPIIRGPDPDLVAHARAAGADLYFTIDSDDDLLPFELVKYDGSTGAFEAWVQLPELKSSNRIALQYGGAPVLHVAEAAWSPDFVGVWHLAPQPNSFRDSSAFGNDATANNQAPATAVGIAGDAVNFVNSMHRLTVGDNASLDFGLGSFSFSLWVNVATSAGDFDKPLYKGGSTAGDAGYTIELGRNAWNVLLSDGITVVQTPLGVETDFLSQWVQLAAVVDRTAQALRVYANGTARSNTSIITLGSLGNSTNLTFSHATYSFRGLLDEMRIYKAAMSPEWFVAEHALVTNNATYVTFTPEEN